MKKVYGLIRRLGANSKYKGYFFVAEAVKISMGDQCKPLRITKDIYPCLARKYRSTPTNIEHDIRTMVNVCWEGNKKLLDEIAGYPLEYKPTNSEFIACVLPEGNRRRELTTAFQKESDSWTESSGSYHPRTAPGVYP